MDPYSPWVLIPVALVLLVCLARYINGGDR